MKHVSLIALILITVCVILPVFSQTTEAPYEIGVWPGFNNSAVTFTFDDGSPSHYQTVIPLFNEFDMNMTLFIVTGSTYGWQANWDALTNAAQDGHEIASHTMTHTSFAGMDDSTLTWELRESKDIIEQEIPDPKCITMAYPYCVTGKKSIMEQYYDAARICSGQIERSTPRNFMGISSIVCGTEGSVKTADNFISRANSAVNSKGWCVYLLHGVDNDGGWSPVPSGVLRETLQHFQENPGEYWVDSFGNVVRYIRERDNAVIDEIVVDNTQITILLSDSLDDARYNLPVSIRRALPKNWISASATQNGSPIPASLVLDNDIWKIQFDAVPDAGEIVIKRENSVGVLPHKPQSVFTFSLEQNYPNPFNPETTIAYTIPKPETVSIQICNSTGAIVRSWVKRHQSAGRYRLTLHGADLASGIYHYSMQAGTFKETRRLTLLK